MAYQVIARKWRPQRFDDVIGQRGVTQTLCNAIRKDRLAQTFVFAGPRGVGKTTTARILARALNCVTGPTVDPCGECDACREIAEGRDIDVLVIDAATHTQVENEGVKMYVEIERAPKSLDDRHRATAPVHHAILARSPAEEAENRPHGPAHDCAAQGVIPGQPVTQAQRQTQHPLPHGHPREHPVDEMRGALRHAPSTTALAKRASLTAEGHQAVEPTPRAPEPREAPAERATPQEVAKLLLHEAWEAVPVAEVNCLRPKYFEVVAHHLIQDARGGLPRSVGHRRRGHAGLIAEPVPRCATPETGE